MSKIAIEGNASGTGTFTIASPNSNNNRTLTLPDSTGTIALQNGVGVGKVLQVVQTTKTNTFSTSSQSFVDITGLSVTITPNSSANKILVFYHAQHGTDGYSDIRLIRDSTAIALGDASGNQTQSTTHFGSVSGQATVQLTYSMCWLDSPSTTSATTYKLQIANPYSAGYTSYINRSPNADNLSYNARTVSTITVMEIAA
jgi:hypothetical protein